MAGYQSVRKADDRYRSLFTMPGLNQRETGILTVGHRPLCVYHLSTWRHHTWPDLPAFPRRISYWKWWNAGCGNEANVTEDFGSVWEVADSSIPVAGLQYML